MTDSLKWLVIGNGMAGRVHQHAIARINDAQLVGVVSNHPPPESGIPHFQTISAALSANDVDVAVVATPNHTHLEIAQALLEAAVPVLCEKPAGRNAREAGRLVQLGQQLDLPIGVVLNQRFCRANRWVHQLIGNSELTVRHVTFELTMPPLGGWQADPNLSGGGLLRLIGIHYLDLLRWWLGEPSNFSGAISGQPVDDEVEVSLQFSGNCFGQLSLRANAAERGGPIRCHIEADQGNIEMLGPTVVGHHGVPPPPEIETSYPDQWFGPGHLTQLRETNASLASSGHFPVSLIEALPSLTLMDRLYAALY